MLYTFLLTLLIIDSVVLIVAILLQSGKGGGLAASFGGASSSPDALIGTRQAGNLLTKVSWWGGGIFLGLAFMLQLMSTHTPAPRSVLDQASGHASRRTSRLRPTSAPAVPLAPAPTPTAPRWHASDQHLQLPLHKPLSWRPRLASLSQGSSSSRTEPFFVADCRILGERRRSPPSPRSCSRRT